MSIENINTTTFKKKNDKSTGRPKGSKNKSTMALIALQNLGEKKAKMVFDKILAACESGDIQACKIIYDKFQPNAKSGSIPRPILDSSTLKTPEDYKMVADELFNAAATGQCSIDEAGDLAKQLVDHFNHIYKEVVIAPQIEELKELVRKSIEQNPKDKSK